MKREFFTIATLLCLALLPSSLSAKEIAISLNELPVAAKSFVENNFSDKKVVSTIKDSELLSTEYKVYFSDGTKIDFTSKGEWKEVDARKGCVPSSTIPVNISSYISENYPGICVAKIETDREFMSFYYKIELQNGIDLRFDKNGAFLGFDD